MLLYEVRLSMSLDVYDVPNLCYLGLAHNSVFHVAHSWCIWKTQLVSNKMIRAAHQYLDRLSDFEEIINSSFLGAFCFNQVNVDC